MQGLKLWQAPEGETKADEEKRLGRWYTVLIVFFSLVIGGLVAAAVLSQTGDDVEYAARQKWEAEREAAIEAAAAQLG